MSSIAPNQRTRLRYLLASVFVLLLVPAITLAYLGYRQLQFEAFYQHQSMAAELTSRIDRRATELFASEDTKSFVQFGFLIVGEGNFVQRSPLSTYPVTGDVPGLVSYFQVDADGAFSTPLLPKDAAKKSEARGDALKRDTSAAQNIEPVEFEARRALENRVRNVLAGSESAADEKQLADAALDEISPIAEESQAISSTVGGTIDNRKQNELAEGQRVFERLNAPQVKAAGRYGKVAELKLKETFASEADQAEPPSDDAIGGKTQPRPRRLEKNVETPLEQTVVPFTDLVGDRLTMFESEVDPFRFNVIDDDHFVLYRNVWRDQKRLIQGAVIERAPFLDGLVGSLYRNTALAAVSNLIVAYQGEVLHTYQGGEASRYTARADEITGTLLYRTRLTAPINDIELIFGFTELPMGPGGTLIAWTTLTFLVLLIGGFTLIYRLGLRQIELGEQQQDFVSAVSHELKTPLTSIRMYGEILKAGWASEDKKRSYYDFIFAESERLTRLINNVLRLARFNRNGTDLELRTLTVGELVDVARSKITAHVEESGFELIEQHEDSNLTLVADTDAFVQIVINLIDNALKFSATASDKQIDFHSRRRNAFVEFSIRDYGPGVPKDQMKKIFKLFYRTQRELTRETVGTGIGLALVHELATAMGGNVDVKNAEPGAEFRVRLPLESS